MGNINLLSNRSRLANSTRHSRLTLWQKKRWSRLNLNATKQGRVWNMYISILAFSSFAYRKLKLGQNYWSAEKNSYMDIVSLLFVSLVTICCMRTCILACMRVRALCLVSGEKPSALPSTCSVECTNTGSQCSHTQLQSLSRQMLSSHTTPPNFPCSILGSVHL